MIIIRRSLWLGFGRDSASSRIALRAPAPVVGGARHVVNQPPHLPPSNLLSLLLLAVVLLPLLACCDAVRALHQELGRLCPLPVHGAQQHTGE